VPTFRNTLYVIHIKSSKNKKKAKYLL